MNPRGTSGEPRALTECRTFVANQEIDTTAANWRIRLPKPPTFDFSDGRTVYWSLQTNQGPLKLRLMPDVAPMHVSSTMFLTELGFYDGLKFHRIIPSFMAQGGCPLGTGTGSPGYRFDGEFDPEVKHDRKGLLSMANAGPGTDGSQFFITFVPTPHLDGKHTIFGEVVEGLDSLTKMEAQGLDSRGRTRTPVILEKAEIVFE